MVTSTSPQGFYDGASYRLDDSIGYLMRQIVTRLSAAVEERMSTHGLTDAQWKPLFMLRQGRCQTAAELARQACSDAGAVTRLLDRVEAKGLVRRVRSSADRRVVKLELTESGTQVADIVPHVLAEVLNESLAGFAADEVGQLRTLLQRMLENTQRWREPSGDAS